MEISKAFAKRVDDYLDGVDCSSDAILARAIRKFGTVAKFQYAMLIAPDGTMVGGPSHNDIALSDGNIACYWDYLTGSSLETREAMEETLTRDHSFGEHDDSAYIVECMVAVFAFGDREVLNEDAERWFMLETNSIRNARSGVGPHFDFEVPSMSMVTSEQLRTMAKGLRYSTATSVWIDSINEKDEPIEHEFKGKPSFTLLRKLVDEASGGDTCACLTGFESCCKEVP